MLKVEFTGKLSGLKVLLARLKLDSDTKVEFLCSMSGAVAPVTPEDKAEDAVRKILPANKIQAIKAIREVTSWDLVTARNFAEGPLLADVRWL